MRIVTATMPSAMKPKRSKPDVRLTILIAFVSGILLGVPLTFAAVFLGTLNQVSLAPADEKLYKSVVEAITPTQQTIREEQPSAQLGHPAATRLTNIGKSGLGTPTIHRPAGGSKHRGKFRSIFPYHASDFYSSDDSKTSYDVQQNFATIPPTYFISLTDGIFWTEIAESYVPKGFDEEDARQWRRFLNATNVVKVEEGCGRMQNRLVTLSDGKLSCCRYRFNNDQIQGEIFSFYLGRLLNMSNLSPSTLALVDPRTKRWSSAASQMALAEWNPDHPAVLTRFVENLEPAYIPKHFRDSKRRRLYPIKEDLHNLTAPEISDLVQWTDLVVFDYLTANLDRVVNNMFNEQWNSRMMSEPTHNLAKAPDGLILFLDNESGLLHGYRLLDKYEHFHRALLDVLCLFRKRTARAIEKLHRNDNIDILLKQAFMENDPGMSNWLPFLPDKSVKTLKERISKVYLQIQRCRSRFGPAPVTDR